MNRVSLAIVIDGNPMAVEDARKLYESLGEMLGMADPHKPAVKIVFPNQPHEGNRFRDGVFAPESLMEDAFKDSPYSIEDMIGLGLEVLDNVDQELTDEVYSDARLANLLHESPTLQDLVKELPNAQRAAFALRVVKAALGIAKSVRNRGRYRDDDDEV